MKSELAIKRELKRVESLRRSKRMTVASWYDMRGAEQALAWVMEDHAAAPSTCAILHPVVRKSGRTKP